MARAKNTARGEARRRARLEARAELEAAREQAAAQEEDARAVSSDSPAVEPRRSAFRLPNFRQDIRDLPQVFRSRRAMAIPPLMLVVGFALQLGSDAGVIPTRYGVPMPLAANGWISFAELALLYVQLFFLPPTLLTFFLAGYLAPRASWLVGLVLGVLSAMLWGVVLTVHPLGAAALMDGQSGDLLAVVGYFFVLSVGYGTFAAAAAAWYRDLLRRMRDQGIARRTEREARERAKRREQRQDDRRSLKRSAR